MSKRSFEESRGSQAPEGDNNGLLAIHDLLSPGDEQDPTPPSGATKKPRNFIAAVVCNCSRRQLIYAVLMLCPGLRDLSLEEDAMRRVAAEMRTVPVPRPRVCLQ